MSDRRIIFSFYLRLGVNGSVEAFKRPPSLAPDERAVALTLAVPASVFGAPTLRAEISFEGDLIAPDTVELSAQVQDLLESGGMCVEVKPVEHPNDD